ncbi:hypothetical protein [Azospirillum sp. B506]|uniref:hypothetical protein n=1 Tax=Azospirillum sp. B506 TaxID=137721 RepID=UPI0005B2AC82|nr:hypothetical protein [Azospirillum sp. B506]
MGYSLKDLERAGQRLNDHFDQKARQQGEAAGQALYESTMRGRGLWFILHVPVWIIIMAFTSSIVNYFTKSEWIGYGVGLVIATYWYRLDFTRERPFVSFILGGFVFPFILIEVLKRQGLW